MDWSDNIVCDSCGQRFCEECWVERDETECGETYDMDKVTSYKGIPIVWDDDSRQSLYFVPGKQDEKDLRILATLMGATTDEQVTEFIRAWRRKFGG